MKFLPFAIILTFIPRLQAFGTFQIQAGVDWWTPLLIFLGLLLIVAVALIINARQSTAELVSSHVGVEDEAHTDIAAALPEETPELPPDLVTESAPEITGADQPFNAEEPATIVENETTLQSQSTEPLEPAPALPEAPVDQSAAVVSAAILEEPVAPPRNDGLPPVAIFPVTPASEEESSPAASEDTASPAETDTPPES